MSETQTTTPATRAERMELARCANVQIQGLAIALLRMVQEGGVDSDATTHHAVRGMLASISTLSDDIFGLVFGDEEDEVSRQMVCDIMSRLGLERIALHTG